MKKSSRLRFSLFSFLMILFAGAWCLFSRPVMGETVPLERIVKDLGPLDAVIIKGSGQRIVINKGLKRNVHKGDLWMVYATGEAITDPGTHEVLGSLMTPMAMLKVIRPEKLFSEVAVRCLRETCAFNEGTVAHRFREIEAVFRDDKKGAHTRLYEWLRMKFPFMNWQGYETRLEAAGTPPLSDGVSFIVEKDRLVVWSGGDVVGIYDIAEKPKPVAAPPARPGRARLPVPGLPGRRASRVFHRVLSIDRIAYSLQLQEIGPARVPFLFYLTKSGLCARELEGKAVFHYHHRGFGDMVSISVNPDGLVAVNVFVQREGMQSAILKFNGKGFRVVARDINRILGFFDRDGDGRRETLLGESYDAEDFFGSGVYELEIRNGRVKRKSSLRMPANFTVFGSFWADLDGNGIPEVGFYNPGRKLVLREKGRKRWESPAKLGGSSQVIKMEIMEAGNVSTKDIVVWSRPAVMRVEKQYAVAVPITRTDILKMLRSTYENARIGWLYYSEGRYVFSPMELRFQGPVQDLFVYHDTLYCMALEGNFFTQEGRSHLMAASLKELLARLQ